MLKNNLFNKTNLAISFFVLAFSICVSPLMAQANINSVEILTPQVTGGSPARVTFSLASPAPTGGVKIIVTSSNSSATFSGATTFTTLVPAGEKSGKFTLQTIPVSRDSEVTITVGEKESSKTGTFTILAPVLKSLNLSSANVIAGQTVAAKISISSPAPKEGFTISLSSSSSKATVPTQLTVSAGQTIGSFDIKTVKTTADEQVVIDAVSPIGNKQSGSLTIQPSLEVASIVLDKQRCFLRVDCGNSINGTITLNRAAPTTGANIILSSNQMSSATVQPSLIIPVGQNTASFSISINENAQDGAIEIAAVIGSDTRKTTTLELEKLIATAQFDRQSARINSEPGPHIYSGGFQPYLYFRQIAKMGSRQREILPSTYRFKIYLKTNLGTLPVFGTQTPTNSRTEVYFSNNISRSPYSSVINYNPPNTQVETSDQITAQVELEGIPDSMSEPTTINLTIYPVTIQALSLSKTTLRAGESVTATYILSESVRNQNREAILSLTDPRFRIDANPRPQTNIYNTSSFTISTPVDILSPTVVTATADYYGQTKTVEFTVLPTAIQSLTLDKNSIEGGETVMGRIQMSGQIAPNQLKITASDPNAVINIFNGNMDVLNSNNSNGFQLQTSRSITSPTLVTITANYGTETQTTQLTINKPSVLSNISLPNNRLLSNLITKLRIELDGPAPANGKTVWLNTGNRFDIPAGQSFGLFDYDYGSSGSTTRQVSITASFDPPGVTSNLNPPPPTVSTTYTIEPLKLDFCSSNQYRNLRGETTINCNVKLLTNGLAAPEGGIDFTVVSSATQGGQSVPSPVTTPSILTIPAGQTEANLQINPQPVTTQTTVVVTLYSPMRRTSYSLVFSILPP